MKSVRSGNNNSHRVNQRSKQIPNPHRVIVEDELDLIKVDQLPHARIVRGEIVEKAQGLGNDGLRVAPIL